MYSASMNQKIGTIAEKDFAKLDEDTIVIDAVKLMRDMGISSIFVTKSSKKVQEKKTRTRQESYRYSYRARYLISCNRRK